MIRRLIALAVAALSASTIAFAAVPQPGQAPQPARALKAGAAEMPSRVATGTPRAPESFRAGFAAVDVASFPPPEKSTGPAIDAQGRLRVASVRALPEAAGVPDWTAIPDGFVNTLRATSEGAQGLRVLLKVGRLATPLEIRAMGTDGRVESVIADPARGTEIWTPWTPGSSQVIELFSPSGAPIPAVGVASVLHFDTSPVEKATAATCTVPVSCSTGSPNLDNAIAERAKSSVRITFVEGSSGFLCSATLLNSERVGVGYLLTANHCISTSASAASVATFWFYEPNSCDDTALKFGMVQLSGGSTLTFTNYNPDGTLLRMNEAPPAGAVYSGWNAARLDSGASVVSISHPRGDTMRLATGSITREYRINERAQDEYGVLFDRGIIEGGSSGSGLFTLSNGQLQLRGVLTGTTVRNASDGMSCTNLTEEALYGRWEILAPQMTPYMTVAGAGTDDTPNRVQDYIGTPLDTPLNGRGATFSRRIDRIGDVDVFRFNLSASATVTLGTGGTMDTIGTLMDTNGKAITANDDVGPGNLNFGITRQLAAGTYFVMVAPWDADGTGSYTFTMSATTDAPPTSGGSGSGTNYSDLWWSAENGWGLNISHQGDILFALLYTYDATGNPMWFFMSNGNKQSDGSYMGTLYRANGHWFGAPGWSANSTTEVGLMRISFNDAGTGTLSYSVNGQALTKTIRRFAFATPATSCTFTSGSRASSTNYQDLWWNPAESGWGLSLVHQGNILFGLLYVYDSNGTPMWLSMSEGRLTGTRTYSGTLYISTGPPFYTSPWTPASTNAIGQMTLAFSDGENGTLTYTVNGLQVVKQIKRTVYANPTPLCTPAS